MQRRHQKIIEEAPAVRLTFCVLNINFLRLCWSYELAIINSVMQPDVSTDFRAHLGQAAVSAAKVKSFASDMLNFLSCLPFVKDG